MSSLSDIGNRRQSVSEFLHELCEFFDDCRAGGVSFDGQSALSMASDLAFFATKAALQESVLIDVLGPSDKDRYDIAVEKQQRPRKGVPLSDDGKVIGFPLTIQG